MTTRDRHHTESSWEAFFFFNSKPKYKRLLIAGAICYIKKKLLDPYSTGYTGGQTDKIPDINAFLQVSVPIH